MEERNINTILQHCLCNLCSLATKKRGVRNFKNIPCIFSIPKRKEKQQQQQQSARLKTEESFLAEKRMMRIMNASLHCHLIAVREVGAQCTKMYQSQEDTLCQRAPLLP